MSENRTPFFVGYLSAPKGLRSFLLVSIVSMLLSFAGVGWLLATTQTDPGSAGFLPGRQTLIGVLENKPYPMLHITEGSNRISTGTTVLLSGGGKRGVQSRGKDLEGAVVRISGQALARGDLQMIQLRGGMQGLADMSDTEAPGVEVEDLGKWRLQGEICDGKCLAGAMRPGTGLAHKACANLCLTGGVPPVFVSSQPIEGSEFLLIGNANGEPLTEQLLDYTAIFVEAEGRIERRGSLLVFLIDPAKVRPLP